VAGKLAEGPPAAARREGRLRPSVQLSCRDGLRAARQLDGDAGFVLLLPELGGC